MSRVRPLRSRRLAVALLLLGITLVCPSCSAPVPSGVSVLFRARARPVPSQLQARVRIVVDSPLLGLAGTTTGGLVVGRPGKGRVDLFGPIGGSLATLSCDGLALAVTVPGDQKHLHASDAEVVIRELTHQAAGVDDLLAVLVGDLPFDGAPVQSAQLMGSEALVMFASGDGVWVEVTLDRADATPRSVTARDRNGKLLFRATYSGWTSVGGALVPTLVQMQAPALQLNLSLQYSDWAPPSDGNSRFSTQAPSGFVTESLEHALRRTLVGLAVGR